MRPGDLKHILTFYPVTAKVTNGDAVETIGSGVDVRAHVNLMSANKKMAFTELLTKKVYEADCYDNIVISDASVCAFGSETLVVHAKIPNYEHPETKDIHLILVVK